MFRFTIRDMLWLMAIVGYGSAGGGTTRTQGGSKFEEGGKGNQKGSNGKITLL